MDNSLKKHNSKLQYQTWSERVKDCRNSGLPVRTWCANNGIRPSTYYTWQKRLFNAVTKSAGKDILLEEPKPEFAEIPAVQLPSVSEKVLAATIVVGKTSVDVYNDIQPELLQVILQGLAKC